MINKFYDSAGSGFFDAGQKPDSLGVLGTVRKPFQDSPTPAGNPMAAIALIRLHGYSGNDGYREKALRTLGLLTETAGQYGLFAATYGIAAAYASYPHTQLVIVGDDRSATSLYSQALSSARFGTSVIRLKFNQAVAQNLPPTLAATIPELPSVKQGRTVAVLCRGASCQPPVSTLEELKPLLAAS
jgi:uncharacterized protein YyaL (SSP411 family)